MKKIGFILLTLLLLSACEEEVRYDNPENSLINLTNQLIEQNNKLNQNISFLEYRISNLKKESKDQEEDIEALRNSLEEFYDLPLIKEGPYDRISTQDLKLYRDQVVIKIKDASISSIADTHSLEPLLDKDANVIGIEPKSPEDIHIGDIASYKSNISKDIILHRVINISKDEDGWYAKMKGDNNFEIDPEKVRFEQIQRVVVGIIY